MNVFITGSASGQLHWELLRSVPLHVNLLELPERLDITDREAVSAAIQQLNPDVVINAAAYTAVDKAETDVDAAAAVNTTAVETLALAVSSINAHLIHVSTDFVFGKGDGSPFIEQASVDPVSVYGKTKLAGEQVLAKILPDDSLVVRTAWVYSSHGGNFVKTMLRLMKERGEVGVIADQIGSPTWANALARALWVAADKKSSGVMHWTGAVELTRTWEQLGIKAAHWREDLRTMLKELT